MLAHLLAQLQSHAAVLTTAWYAMPQTYHCASVLVITGGLAAAAGIGGGGIIVAVLMFVGDLAPHDAVPMSKAVVFAGVLVSSLMNVRKRGPNGQALVDFDIVASIVPMALAGTLLGVWANSRVSAEAIVLILIGTFALMLASTGQKLSEQIQEEAEQEVYMQNPHWKIGCKSREDQVEIRRQLILRDRDELSLRADRRNMALIWTLAALLCSVISGGVLHQHMMECHASIASKSRDTCESHLLGLVFGAPHHFLGGPHGLSLATFPLFASMVCCAVCFVGIYLGFNSRSGRYEPKPSVHYSVMALATGFLAGLVGIGGGLIFSPFMLWYGVNPHVAVATSTFCVIFTSTSTTLQYSLMGRIYLPLAIVYGLCNQISSYGGTMFIHAIQDRYPLKKSLPTMIVFIAVACSAVLTLAKLHTMAQSRYASSSVAVDTSF